MPAHHPPDVMIRPAAQDDRGFVRQLAPRLLVGYAAWRDASLMLHTMERFLLESFEAPPDRGMRFIAERADWARLGAVSVAHNVNFTGEPQAYMGELAVVELFDRAPMHYRSKWYVLRSAAAVGLRPRRLRPARLCRPGSRPRDRQVLLAAAPAGPRFPRAHLGGDR